VIPSIDLKAPLSRGFFLPAAKRATDCTDQHGFRLQVFLLAVNMGTGNLIRADPCNPWLPLFAEGKSTLACCR